MGTNILNELIKKVENPFFKNAKHVTYVLFSKSGFTESLKKQINSDTILIDLSDMAVVLDYP